MVQPAFCFDNFLSFQRHDLIKSNYTILEWNIKNNYLMDFKKNIINYVHADFVILPETHCFPHQKLEIENYTSFQNNRKVNNNSVKGSGGIAIAVKNDIFEDHTVLAVFNDIVEGQIALKLKNVKNDLKIGIIGLYLPPDNYIYGQDWKDLTGSSSCKVFLHF